MGYMTTVLILNDCWDQIEKHPEQFVEGVREKMHGGGTVSVGICANPVEVMNSEHADVFRLYATQANTIIDLSPWDPKTKRLMKSYPELIRDQIDKARFVLDRLEEAFDDDVSG